MDEARKATCDLIIDVFVTEMRHNTPEERAIIVHRTLMNPEIKVRFTLAEKVYIAVRVKDALAR